MSEWHVPCLVSTKKTSRKKTLDLFVPLSLDLFVPRPIVPRSLSLDPGAISVRPANFMACYTGQILGVSGSSRWEGGQILTPQRDQKIERSSGDQKGLSKASSTATKCGIESGDQKQMYVTFGPAYLRGVLNVVSGDSTVRVYGTCRHTCFPVVRHAVL